MARAIFDSPNTEPYSIAQNDKTTLSIQILPIINSTGFREKRIADARFPNLLNRLLGIKLFVP